MPENVVERVVVPRNPPVASVLNKEKFNLFAPMAKTNSPGLAAYNPDDFIINDQIVSLNPVILQEIEENKEDLETLINELNDLFERYDVTLETLNKAITDGLTLMDALKLDKSTDASSVYVTDENGSQTLLRYAMSLLGYALVQRTSKGDVLVPDEPTSVSGAVNRKYVDDGLSKKLDALTNGDHNTTWLYGNDYTGKYGLFKASPHGKTGHIVMYGAPDRTGGSEPDGTIGVHMPERPYQATPREYVDTNTPAHIAVSMVTEGEGEGKKEYVLRLSLVNRKGDAIPGSEASIDLPLEMAFVGAEAVEDENGNEFVEFTLQNGETLRVGLSEIFKGKVDKTTESWKLYGTGSGGNPHLYNVSTNGKNGAVPRYFKQEETSMDSDAGYLNTPDPKYDFNCVNKRTLAAGLAGKFSLPSNLGAWSVLGIGDYNAETGEYTPHRFIRNQNGTGLFIATFGLISDAASFDRTDDNFVKSLKYTLGVPDPIYPIQVANKRYVDGKVDPIASDVADLKKTVGAKYELRRETYTSVPAVIPNNAMRHAYISKLSPYLPDPEVKNKFVTTPTNIGEYDKLSYDAASNVFTIDTAGKSRQVNAALLVTPVNFGSARKLYISIEVISGTLPADVEVLAEDADGLITSDDVVVLSKGETRINSVLEHSFVEGDLTLDTLQLFCNKGVWDNVQLRISISADAPTMNYEYCTPSFMFVGGGVRGAFTFLDGLTYNGYGVADLSMIHEGERVYNYMDFEAKEFVVRCYRESRDVVVLADEEIRLPITEDINPKFTTIAGGEITFGSVLMHPYIPTNNIMYEIVYVLDREVTA